MQRFEAGLESETNEPQKTDAKDVSEVSEPTKPESKESSFCIECGCKLPESSKFCPKCGKSVTLGTEQQRIENKLPSENPSTTYSGQRLQRPPEWKSEGITLVLTIVCGIFGFGGIGHLYLGKLLRGIVILVVGIILLVITIVSSGVGLIILIPFAIWVVFDARKLCREYNDYLEKYGKKPW